MHTVIDTKFQFKLKIALLSFQERQKTKGDRDERANFNLQNFKLLLPSLKNQPFVTCNTMHAES